MIWADKAGRELPNRVFFRGEKCLGCGAVGAGGAAALGRLRAVRVRTSRPAGLDTTVRCTFRYGSTSITGHVVMDTLPVYKKLDKTEVLGMACFGRIQLKIAIILKHWLAITSTHF